MYLHFSVVPKKSCLRDTHKCMSTIIEIKDHACSVLTLVLVSWTSLDCTSLSTRLIFLSAKECRDGEVAMVKSNDLRLNQNAYTYNVAQNCISKFLNNILTKIGLK